MVKAITTTKTPTSAGVASSADPRARAAAPKPYSSNAGIKKPGSKPASPNVSSATNNTSVGDGGPLTKPISVIVAAHNDAANIKPCLEAILAGAGTKELEVVVVCYACTDDTVMQAKNFGSLVKVIETQSPSKTAAINLADASLTAFPRFYVDSNVLINIDALRRVATILRTSENVEAAAPAIQIDISESPWMVRAYYQVWLQRDRVRYGLVGHGVAAITEMGHDKFRRFPVVQDEGQYLRLHFNQKTRRTITGCVYKIKGARSILSVFHENVRQRIGMCEVKDLFPELLKNENRRGLIRDMTALTMDLANWLPMAIYLPVSLAAEVTARVKMLWSWWRPKNRAEPKPKIKRMPPAKPARGS